MLPFVRPKLHLKYSPSPQDGGAPTWQCDPHLNAIVLHNIYGGGPDRWVTSSTTGTGTEEATADSWGSRNSSTRVEVSNTAILNPNPIYQVKSQERVIWGEKPDPRLAPAIEPGSSHVVRRRERRASGLRRQQRRRLESRCAQLDRQPGQDRSHGGHHQLQGRARDDH